MIRHRCLAVLLAVVGLGVAVAAVPLTSGAGAAPNAVKSGGVANFAELVGGQITYIFPLLTCPVDTSQNAGEFQNLLFKHLYTLDDGAKVALNERTSLAYAPTYSHNDTEVSVRMKAYKWADGETVDASDVIFWENLYSAAKTNDCTYVPGYYPDDIVSAKADGPMEVTFTLNHSYSPSWFTDNELSQIIPLPLAWDKTSTNKSSNCAGNEKDCDAVYSFLSSQAKQLSTYASNPLWKIVDGPWTLKAFSVDGSASFVPNRRYSGPDKPHLSEFNEVPFTSTAAEYDTLRAGNSIQVGYIPFTDAPAKGAPNPVGSNYRLEKWGIWGFGYIPMNEANPVMGPVFKQVYFRQAMQSLLNQTAVVNKLLHGYGSIGTGPIPSDVTDPYLTSRFRTSPFPFSVVRAKSLLSGHGWVVKPNGVTECGKAGTGAKDCGPGIAKGTRLVIKLVDASAPPWIGESMQDLKSIASEVGIQINLSSEPANTVIGDISASTSWQMLDWGSPGWTYVPTVYPSGEDLYKSGSPENDSHYRSSKMDALLTAVITKPGQSTLNTYEAYVRQQIPVLYQPTSAYQISEVASDLHGVVPQSPLDAITPQDWYFTK